MKIQIHELAARELEEAIEWYELQSEGLGERFKEATLIRRIGAGFCLQNDPVGLIYFGIGKRKHGEMENAHKCF